MTERNGSDRKKKPARKKKRRGWGTVDDIMYEQELQGGHRRTRAGGGWRVLKKPLPRWFSQIGWFSCARNSSFLGKIENGFS